MTNQAILSEQNQTALSESNQWVVTYYKAVSKAWSDQKFKAELLENANSTLKSVYGFTVPQNIMLKFEEVENNNFSEFPAFSLSIFDKSPEIRTVLKIPLPSAPAEGLESINYLDSLSSKDTAMCCCACI